MKTWNSYANRLFRSADEKRSFALLFLLSLITGCSLSYYFVAVNTFLISNTDINSLPIAYILSGTVGFFLLKIYQLRQQKNTILRNYTENIIIFCLVSLLMFACYLTYDSHKEAHLYLAYLGFVFNMPITVIFSLNFFAICAKLFNLSQSKRLLAVVSSGEIIASIIAYLTTPFIILWLDHIYYLFPMSALFVLMSYIPLILLHARQPEQLKGHKTRSSYGKRIDLSFFLNDRFYIAIGVVTIISVGAIYFTDYSYLLSVGMLSEHTGIAITTILAVFFSIVKFGELLFSLLSGSIILAKGIKFAILLLPISLLLSFGFAAGSGLGWHNPIFLIAFVFIAKWCERVIRRAITTPATKVIYQATGPLERLQIEANIEGILNQISAILAGVILLLLSNVIAHDNLLDFLSYVALICFLTSVLWAGATLKLYKHYKGKLEVYLTTLRPHKERALTSSVPPLTDLFFSSNLGEKLQEAFHLAHQQNELTEAIRCYLPAIAQDHHFSSNNDTLLHKLEQSYYRMPSFFSRLSTLKYIGQTAFQWNIHSFDTYWNASDLSLRIILTRTANQSNMAIDEAFRFRIATLCEQICTEMAWTLSTKRDLQYLNDSTLMNEINHLLRALRQLLFLLLKVYSAESARNIQVAYDILSVKGQNEENHFFALELLDAVLDDSLKELVLPLLEPLPFDQQESKLKKIFPIHHFTVAQRLKDILMHDPNVVGPYLKQLVLEHYHHLTGDNLVAHAFKTSPFRNIRHQALQLLGEPVDHDQQEWENLCQILTNTLDYDVRKVTCLMNWACHDDRQGHGKSTHHSKGLINRHPYMVMQKGSQFAMWVDALAISLLKDVEIH
ncbi:hypothetical protein [Olivibacter sitiensis]|uniref:hypothetical protein n=1 Tax=Olivibacter sitiensis TaxID=376470 RepID=UPI000410DFC2|nr:hypothetical protein [Olivibacter sitiensis]